MGLRRAAPHARLTHGVGAAVKLRSRPAGTDDFSQRAASISTASLAQAHSKGL